MTEAPKRILLIDDDKTASDEIRMQLLKRGFSVLMSHDSRHGIAAIINLKPDLVLCNISMPLLGGLDIARLLLEIDPKFSTLPLVFLAKPEDLKGRLKESRLGTGDYVTKPIDYDRLEHMIWSRLGDATDDDLWSKVVTLKPAEISVLTLVARGMISTEISKATGLCKRTIDFHLDNARLKLRAKTRTHAVVKALLARLIDPSNEQNGENAENGENK